MNYFNFEDLDDITHVAEVLGCKQNFIESVIDYSSGFYRQLSIPKKKGKEYRIVYKVDDKLKNLHKNILVSIAKKVDFPEYVQGFVSKRSIITNASLHLAKRYVLNLDIKDFFESIKIEQVIDVFKDLGCNDKVANVFAELCTYNQCLVQGANTSPILANLVCTDLDKELVSIGQEYACSYSRYADDITFSGEKVPKKNKVSRCIEKHGFTLNQDKWKCKCRGKAQYVTGLTVFDNVQPRLPKKMKRQLRQILYYIDKYGLENHLDRIETKDNIDSMVLPNQIDGLIAFMYSVEPKYAYEFDVAWQNILVKEGNKPSRNPSKLLRKWQSQKEPTYSNKFVEQTAQEVNKLSRF